MELIKLMVYGIVWNLRSNAVQVNIRSDILTVHIIVKHLFRIHSTKKFKKIIDIENV